MSRPATRSTVRARLSEPPELRRQLEQEVRAALLQRGTDPEATVVEVRSAFKQGYSWLYEGVRPRLEGADIGEILIRFRRNDPPAEWPQQAIHTPVRWLHEIFPIGEVLARELGIDLDRIRFEQVLEGPTYQVEATDPDGEVILSESFDPKWVMRPYVDRFRDYERVRVTTGWIEARAADRTLADERIVTDPEAFWDHFQGTTLPAVYDHVMERHEGIPRGGNADAPFFGELVVEARLSEPDYRLEVDNEIHSTMDALHEEVYFGTIEFLRPDRPQLAWAGTHSSRPHHSRDAAQGGRFSGDRGHLLLRLRHLPAGGDRHLAGALRRDRRDAPRHPAHHHGAPLRPARTRA